MKITDKILHIPPYISTTWDRVDYLKMEEHHLVIGLNLDKPVLIPNLSKECVKHIFESHAKHIESHESNRGDLALKLDSLPIGIELEGMPQLGNLVGHNPLLANAPDLPKPILKSIEAITKMLGIDPAIFQISVEDLHCNCPHCQIAKAMYAPSAEIEECISEEDLRFKDWDITQKAEHLFEVIHPLDKEEHYQVYLGEPIGCTCGKNDCEHIRAVLLSS
ncbi:MAG: hypothetical protein FJZ56_00830 [Chlamydiae bacterium]|nr:hypothetical protein [Chlamydiota bacterium]